MARYFQIGIGTNLQTTFKVIYSTNGNATTFDHTASIWDENGSPYDPATGLTYEQITDNGGLKVFTDDDVYQVRIIDENGYCSDVDNSNCTSIVYGTSQVTYSLSGIRLDRELSAFNYVGSQNNNLYLESILNSGYYSINGTVNTYYGAGTTGGDVNPVQDNRSQSGNNIKIFDSSSGYDFGNPGDGLWHSLSGSDGYSGNTNPFGSRTSDIAYGMSFSDFRTPSSFGFSYEDAQNALAYLSFTASFATGTNVTMSVAYASDNSNPSTELNSDWVLDNSIAVEDGSTGLWKFSPSGSDVSFTSTSGDTSWAKPVIKAG